MKYTLNELLIIWLDSFIGLEYKHKIKIYESYLGEQISALISKNKEYILAKLSEKEYSTLKNSCNQEYLEYILNSLDRNEIKVLTLASQNYPEEFNETPCPPLALYYRGNIELLNQTKITIVGSRKSSALAIAKAEQFTTVFTSANLTVVTGIAEGVEETVIKTGLSSGKIVSILAGGFKNIYPSQNANLVKELAKNGLVMSEYPPEVKTEPFHYFARNRLLAALGKGVFVLSGGLKSGTNITANYANDYNKLVFVLPYSVNVPSGEGCNNLIRNGAILATSAEEALEFLGIEKEEKAEIVMSNEEKELYDIIKDGEIHIDKLCQKLNKKVFEITPILTIMEIKKFVVKMSGNIYGVI